MPLRLRCIRRPRPALVVVDTPDPGCYHCLGDGVFDTPAADGEPSGTAYCDCWDPTRRHTLFVVPCPVARLLPGHPTVGGSR